MPVIGDCVGITIERVLFATDFSETADIAAKYVEALAKRFASEVTIVHVLDRSAKARLALKMFAETPAEVAALSQAALELERTVFRSERVRVRTELLEAVDAVKALNELADKCKAEMIVCGTNARKGAERVALGSFAERLILTSKIPVMTIGPNAKVPHSESMRFDKILFTTDLDEGSARRAQLALNLAKDSRAKIYFCHVLKHDRHEIANLLGLKRKFEFDLKMLIPETAYEWCTPECVVGQGVASDYIVEAAISIDADLVVLGASNRSAWTTHFATGVTGRVLRDAPCAVLTIR